MPKPKDKRLKAALEYLDKAGGMKRARGTAPNIHPLLKRFLELCEKIRKTKDKGLTAEADILAADFTAYFAAAAYLEKFNRVLVYASELFKKLMSESEHETPTTKQKI